MKKILILIVLSLGYLFGYSQFPITQNLGSPKTKVVNKGIFYSDSAIIVTGYTDTTQANLGYIKNIPHVIIATSNDIWIRNIAATAWLQLVNIGSGATDTLAWRLSGNNATGMGGVPVMGTTSYTDFNFATNNLKRFSVSKDGIQDSTVNVLPLGIDTTTGYLSYARAGGGGGGGSDSAYVDATAVNDSTLRLYRLNGDSTDVALRGTAAASWTLTGNSGTIAGTNFIGTIDDVDFVIKRFDEQHGRFGNTTVVLGKYAGLSGLPDNSVGIGSATLANNVSGDGLTAVGANALNSNTTGAYSTATGSNALIFNTIGNFNTADGDDNLSNNISGNNNTSLGFAGGKYNTNESGRLYITAYDHGSHNNDSLYSIIHGLMNQSSPSTQKLFLNAQVTMPYLPTGPAAKRVMADANGALYLSDSLVGGGGSGGGIVSLGIVGNYGLTRINDSTYRVDTLAIATRAWRQKGMDSLLALITGGVTSIGVTTANGVSGTSSGGTTPSLTITLGAITPTSVAATSFVRAPYLYGGDMVTTYPTYSGGVLGGTATGGVLDFVHNNSRIGEFYTTSGAFNFFTDVSKDLNFYVNSSLSVPALGILSTGNVGIGLTTPTAGLHLKAGTTTLAPIKLNTGTALTTPEDGAIEYHGSHIYFTIGSTRYQLDQQAGTNLGNSNLTQTGGNRTFTGAGQNLIFNGSGGTSLFNVEYNSIILTAQNSGVNIQGDSILISANVGKVYIDSLPPSIDAIDSVVVITPTGQLKQKAQSDLVGGLLSGTYTPTLTNVANVAASTAYSCQYSRVGTVVTVSGEVDIDPTTTLTLTQLGISLPIASNLTATNELGGTSADDLNTAARVAGDATNNRAEIRMTPVDVTNRRFSFTFTYRVL